MSRPPVFAAIPNYNMAPQLAELLPRVCAQGYDEVFVLDDASTDDSRDVVAAYNTDIKFVAGDINVGAGGNRNRLIPHLGQRSLIHFIDADVRLETQNIPEVASDLMPSEPTGFVGGLVLNLDGRQNPWNYGPRIGLGGDVGGALQLYFAALAGRRPQAAATFRKRFHYLLQDWPNLLEDPAPRPVFWNAEANMLIQSDVFSGLGGFNPALRDHDVQDLAIRMEQKGLGRRFDPSIAVTHTAVDVRHTNRYLAMLKADVYLMRTYGLRDWLHYQHPGKH